ncbi:MAG: hypothetical protein ACLR9T_05780 [Thomasclavelia sp.]|uniref:hypothetical protein n=1 Tax=Thomasclavelia sp. TaxID=3025757 RepID=UPI0039A12EB4
MKEIVINPFTVEEEINIGYQFDHKATKIVFDGLEDSNYYLKLQDTQSYQAFPIPNNEFEITNTYTQKTLLTGQIYYKIDNELIAHGRVFKMSLKTSIPQSSKIKEVVPPAFKNEYDRMVDTTNEINRKLVAGEFNGENGKDYEHSEEFEQLSKEVKQDALASSSSASSALNNANKAKEHLDNVIEKVNAFNADYTEKVNNFNSNVENANNTLDAKIEKANTDIDKKVLDANTSLDKKIADANNSIDGKVTVATEQANIATSKATELSQAVDKVKHLEDVVDTKLTQPYVSSPLIENATISDSDEGQLRNLKIYGKCTQKVETDIVPTPDRPVPIVSKKIAVNGEVVELRSLKESSNLFDIKMYGFENGLLDDNGVLNSNFKSYASSGFIKVKPNTKYMSGTFNSGAIISSGIFFYNKNKEFISKTDSRPYVTPNECKYVRCGVTINGSTLISDLAIVNNGFVISEGVSSLSSYVAPTVRDYKIVDHVNKKSWIERNIQEVNLNNLNFVYNDTKTDYTRFYAPLNPTVKHVGEIYSNSFPSYKSYDYTKESIYGGNTSGGKTLSVIVKDSNVAEHTKEALLDYINNPNAVAYYALETPIVEEIPYVESDTSEFGISSQDTTSPSPNIKSPIESVKVLNIKACGKNLLNETLAKDYSNYVSLGNWYSKFIVSVKPGTKYVVSRRDTVGLGTNCYVWIKGVASFWMVHTTNENINVNKGYITSTEDGTIEIIIATSNQEKLNQTWDVLGWLQIEEGDTATEYEPYKETVITHTLAIPLLKVGDYADTIDLNKLERKNNIYKEDITTLTVSSVDNAGSYNHTNTTNRFYNLNVSSNAKASPNHQNVMSSILPYVQSVWLYDKTGITINYQQVHISLPNLLIGINSNDSSAERTKKLDVYIKSLKGTGNEYIYYALETPTTEPLEPELIEKLKTLKTFYPITHIISNVPLEFAYKLNMPAWHKVVSGQVEDAKDVIYNMQVKQNNLEVMQLQSALETQYNMDLLKLQGGI